jgi:glycosyltransferase involved in cell wall biosynthesis
MSATARKPIVAFAPDAWSGRRMNRQQILSRLAARGWPVLYSNGALSVWDRGGPRWSEAGWFDRIEEAEGLLLDRPGRLLPRWQRHPLWDRFTVRRHARHLMSFAGERAICYVFHPSFWPYVDVLRPQHLVFHAYDSFDLTDDWDDQLADYQFRLARRADLLVISAQNIAASLPADIRSLAHELPNGADVEAFIAAARSECPGDLAAITPPRIGYAGAINAKLDLNLVLEVARQRHDWHWVVLGACSINDEETRRLWEACGQARNIHYLGHKQHTLVPAYLNHMDVNVMCYRASGGGWWIRGYPLKLHEQLAVGKPVVASPLETIRPFAHVVDLAETPAEWIAAIERALASGGVGTPEERVAVARQNTWDQRVDLLERWLLEMCG